MDVCENNKVVDMVPWITKIDLDQLEKKEKDFLGRLCQNMIFISLKEACDKNGVNIIMQFVRNEGNGYSSFSIDFFDRFGNLINEPDEPNGSIFIYETICYIRNGSHYFIDLLKDDCFMEQLSKIEKVITSM